MIVFEAVLIFILSTVVFDLVHIALHRAQESRNVTFGFLLRKFGTLHSAHHRFFDRRCVNHEKLWAKNFRYHLLPEFVIQLATTVGLSPLFGWAPVALAVLLESVFFLFVVYHRGKDPNHTPPERALRPSMNFYVFPSYHAYHHRFPRAYFSSWFRITDFISGSSWHAERQRVLLTGSSGELGKEMHREFLKNGAKVEVATFGKDYRRENFQGFKIKALQADILVLCNGSKQDVQWSHVTSHQELIALFLEAQRSRGGKTTVPEVWGVGSEIEFHPALLKEDKDYELAKREYARFASSLFKRRDILYRHIVPSAFKSSYGWAPVSARPITKIVFFLIRRGFRYVPASYTGLAWLNYFKFILLSQTPETK